MGFISPPSHPTSVRTSSVLGDTKGRLKAPELYFAPPTCYSTASFHIANGFTDFSCYTVTLSFKAGIHRYSKEGYHSNLASFP